MRLSAYFQCFNSVTATRHTLYNFRKHYPDTDVVLLSDGGLDFTKVAKEFKCAYVFSSNNIKLNVLTPHTAMEVYKRIRDAARYVCEEWMMLLEDDTLVRGCIDPRITGQMMGPYSGNMLGDEVCDYIKIPRGIFQYGGCGGSIVNAKFIRDNFNQEKTREFLEAFAIGEYNEGFTDNRLRSIDYLITCLIYLHGGIYGSLDEFAETTHHGDWRDNKYKIVRQHKGQYWEEHSLPEFKEEVRLATA